LTRRMSAALLTLGLVAGHAGVCAGWLATPEARMGCCTGDHPCPMHKSESDEGGSNRLVSQAEANRCCAASEQDDSAPSRSNVAFSVTLAVVLSPVSVLIPEPEANADIWRASVPIPAAPVRKHLLLSVFLV
jgi:hypothetical protein